MSSRSRNFTLTATTTASPEKVFSFVADSTTWPTWSPIGWVERSNLAPDGTEQVGTIRRFRTGVATSVEEVTGVFPNRRLEYRLRSGMPILNHVASVELESTTTGCTIAWHETFTPKFNGTGHLLEWFLKAFLGKCLKGLVRISER